MQTFLPSPIFAESAHILDYRRLNKQIVEGYQILSGRVPNANHPACLMWSNHKFMLVIYLSAFLGEYLYRTRKHHGLEEDILTYKCESDKDMPFMPPWLGTPLFHLAHRVNLMRKDYDYYLGKFEHPFYKIEEYPEGYYWPIQPVGKKASTDRQAWIEWAKTHDIK